MTKQVGSESLEQWAKQHDQREAVFLGAEDTQDGPVGYHYVPEMMGVNFDASTAEGRELLKEFTEWLPQQPFAPERTVVNEALKRMTFIFYFRGPIRLVREWLHPRLAARASAAVS